MGSEYIKTIHGIISVLQICIGVAALFACSFIWDHCHDSNGDLNVYFQFYWGSYPAHIYSFLALFLTWVAVIAMFILEVSGRDILEALGKMKVPETRWASEIFEGPTILELQL
uniref:Uncharacterized protein n=1 Tax=Panagrolaimus sp. JU765 TaxID=591449 RepID=A0AC34RNJ9_9BILA